MSSVASTLTIGASPTSMLLTDIDALGERIATLSAQISVAKYHLLVLIREFDVREGWNNGFMTCAHWLSWRTGLAPGPAREKVRVARALATLPRISEALQRGRVSYSKARALTRVATPENEQKLLDFAVAGTASHGEKLIRAWRRVDLAIDREREAERHAARSLQIYQDDDGMYVVRGRLDPEAGAALVKALEAGSEVLYDEERERQAAPNDITPSQRRADAVGRVAEAALAGGLDQGTRGDRYQVVVHAETAALASSAVPVDSALPGVSDELALSELEGHDVPAGTSQRIACDASRVVMTHDRDGRILGVGRKTRVVSLALRRALAVRDKTCQFPGCDRTYCDAHHLQHWADGGDTSLDNLVLLCRRHHRCVHEEGYRAERSPDGHVQFIRPDNRTIPAVPPPLPPGVATLARLHEHLGRAGDACGAFPLPTWDGLSLDLTWAIDVMYSRSEQAAN